MAIQDKPLATVKKDPSAIRTFQVDWSAVFPTETITGQLWKVPTGLTKEGESLVSKVHSITLSGGTAGSRYRVTSQVTTSSGEVDERSFEVSVLER